MRDGDTFDTLYRLDLQTKQVEKVYAFANGDVDDVIADFADRDLIGVLGYADRQTEVFLQEDNPAVQTYEALQRAFPDQRINVTSTSSDGRLAIVYVDSDVNPGDYYLFDTVTSARISCAADASGSRRSKCGRSSRSRSRHATAWSCTVT